jgi:ABC-2 type transport system ATP-binding protein
VGHGARSAAGCSASPNPAHIEKVLRDLSLWDKRDSKIMTLSGGMKRRVLIAKALSHEPTILFLDEPTAGVDVELRHDMWKMVRRLRDQRRHDHPDHALHRGGRGDGRPRRRDREGRAHPREDKTTLMRKLGKRQLALELQRAAREHPRRPGRAALELVDEGTC